MMNTPICDFVNEYMASEASRLHVPGHKGHSFLGCETRDITEIAGADVLGEATGIIAESETNAASLFGTYRSFYSTEGSSHVIRAMLLLAGQNFPHHRADGRFTILAARNVHKSFVHACALLDYDVEWMYPDEDTAENSVCSCPITPGQLEAALKKCLPDAVYVTSPDYLGGMQDIRGLVEVCARFGLPLLVDNAHGAYFHFLEEPAHPMDLGAFMCCDSAHKTLPVLTGGAYLHISGYPAYMENDLHIRVATGARQALSVFGTTSPSYLILQSLDLCNCYLADGYKKRLDDTIRSVNQLKQQLCELGISVLPSEPLKLVLSCRPFTTGFMMAEQLRQNSIECEYADAEYVVLMFTPENDAGDFSRVFSVLCAFSEKCHGNPFPDTASERIRLPRLTKTCSIREAIMLPSETIPATSAVGRICAIPTVSCPPAVPIAVSGECFDEEAVRLLTLYGIREVSVLCRPNR